MTYLILAAAVVAVVYWDSKRAKPLFADKLKTLWDKIKTE